MPAAAASRVFGAGDKGSRPTRLELLEVLFFFSFHFDYTNDYLHLIPSTMCPTTNQRPPPSPHHLHIATLTTKTCPSTAETATTAAAAAAGQNGAAGVMSQAPGMFFFCS
jgi:hypothetical protein